jgi:hypothetical protein
VAVFVLQEKSVAPKATAIKKERTGFITKYLNTESKYSDLWKEKYVTSGLIIVATKF